MANDMSAILVAVFLLLPGQTQALECGPVPEEVSKSIRNRTDEFLASWWWKCLGEQSKLRKLERKAKYPPDVLERLEARERMAWELFMGRKLDLRELEREFALAERQADQEAAQAARQ